MTLKGKIKFIEILAGCFYKTKHCMTFEDQIKVASV